MHIYHFHLLLLLFFLFLLLLLGFGCDGENSGGYLPESREVFVLRPNRRRANSTNTPHNRKHKPFHARYKQHFIISSNSKGCGTEQQSKYLNRRNNKRLHSPFPSPSLQESPELVGKRRWRVCSWSGTEPWASEEGEQSKSASPGCLRSAASIQSYGFLFHLLRAQVPSGLY